MDKLAVDDLLMLRDLARTALDELMNLLAITDRELAGWTGVNRDTVRHWRTGRSRMPRRRASDIAIELVRRIDDIDLQVEAREIISHSSRGTTQQERLEAMQRTIDQLRSTLEWYADQGNYTTASPQGGPDRIDSRRGGISVYRRNILNDSGARAREALQEVDHG